MKRTISLLILLSLVFAMFTSVYAGDDNSRDKVVDFVSRFYDVALDRTPDEEGLNDWVNKLTNHQLTGTGLAYGFVYSQEFQNKNATDEEYITYMYKMFFNRLPDPEGLKYWLDKLDEYGKDEGRLVVFAGFVNSVEFKELCDSYDIIQGYYYGISSWNKESSAYLFVERLYEVVLNRSLDGNGRDSWVIPLLKDESTGILTAYNIFASKEYEQLNKSDEEYVIDLYLVFLDRTPDDKGLSDWVNQLSNGKSRTEVLNGVGLSQEFTNLCEQYGITRGEGIRTSNSYVVCIDPGHTGKVAPGNVPLGPGSNEYKPADASGTYGRWSRLNEYELTLQVALKLKEELEARGYTVVMTRTDSSQPLDIIKRAEIANEGSDIFVRLHADALDTSSASGCTAVCISPNSPWHPELYEKSRLLSDCIRNAYCSATGIKNRGVYEWDTMAGNNWSKIPCVLFEMGFMTNMSDDLYMANPDNQTLMAKGIADGIDAYFGL